MKHKFYVKTIFRKFFFLKIKFCFAFNNVPNLSPVRLLTLVSSDRTTA